MKLKTILTLSSLLLAGMSFGQSKQDIIFSALKKLDSVHLDSATLSELRLSTAILPSSSIRLIEMPPQYRDTLNCIVNGVDTTNSVNKWVKAKVVLNNSGLHNPSMRITWTNSYIGMAIGSFNNKFITDFDLTGFVIMQVSITDKNPYKKTK